MDSRPATGLRIESSDAIGGNSPGQFVSHGRGDAKAGCQTLAEQEIGRLGQTNDPPAGQAVDAMVTTIIRTAAASGLPGGQPDRLSSTPIGRDSVMIVFRKQ
jgi:hypothetical protein